MAAGALVVSKRWQEENLEWKRCSYSVIVQATKMSRPTIWLTLPAISVLTRAGEGSFVLDFLCYFLVSRQESRRKEIVAETKMDCSFILTPPCRPPLSLERRGAGGEDKRKRAVMRLYASSIKPLYENFNENLI